MSDVQIETVPEASTYVRFSLTRFQVVRITLALLLLIAAALKGYELATEPVVQQGLLGSRGFLIALVETELILGLWLISGLASRPAWWAAVGLFSAFTLFTLQRAISGAESCGCFGKVQISPWYTLVIDVAVIASLLLWRPQTIDISAGRVDGIRALFVPLLAVVLGLPAAWLMGRYESAALSEAGDIVGNSSFVVLEPAMWVGKPFPLPKHIDIGQQLLNGRWLVVLYRHDCAHCVESLPHYEQKARVSATDPASLRVALVAMPPYASPGQDPVPSVTACTRGKLSDSREWFVQTPAEITLLDGQVLGGREGAEH